MPVKIVRRSEATVATVATVAAGLSVVVKKVVSVSAPDIAGRPKLTKVLKVGKSEILPDMDVHDVKGRTKFLVHLRKKGIWYRIVAYDDQLQRLKLCSVNGTVFDSKTDGTVLHNYMVAVENEDAKVPSPEVIERVQSLIAGMK